MITDPNALIFALRDRGRVVSILFEQIKKDTEAFIEESRGFPKGHPYWTVSFTPILDEYTKRTQGLGD